jgi:L-fuconolactonase
MRLDAHQHYWIFDPQRDQWITDEMQVIRRDFLPADLQPELEKNQIQGTIAVQADESEAETIFLLDLAARHDFIKGVVGWVDLKDKNLLEKLETHRPQQKLRGFRAITQGREDAEYFNHQAFLQGVKSLHAFGYTFDLLIYPDQFPAAIRFTEKCPDQPFMLDHLGKPVVRAGEIKKWREHIRILAQNPRVYCKLSGLVTEAHWKKWRYEDLAPYLEIAGEYFGTERICFGSDWPVCLLSGSYAQVSGILHRFLEQVTPKEREGIWGDNAARFYGIA